MLTIRIAFWKVRTTRLTYFKVGFDSSWKKEGGKEEKGGDLYKYLMALDQ